MTSEEITAAFDAVANFFPMLTSLFAGNIESVIVIFAAVACFSLVTFIPEMLSKAIRGH